MEMVLDEHIIRLITYSINGRAYLNYMGNEFGHLSKSNSLWQVMDFPSHLLTGIETYLLRKGSIKTCFPLIR
ncbi:hypothetical protein L1987_52096 [Smallanthus sonchifolius]|uniref:Uncharacterized protein n=1 Tax=Smallanthus sonchifolius TaxID=185202 RepID=A0ACB9ESR4_9ASTR|nr:hypothetical protein L1987_52096 [Smallanthus sonchifolius]